MQALHGLGLRKFLIAGVGPLGCMPNQIARGFPPLPPGKCLSDVNEMVRLFNNRLVSLVDQLNSRIDSLGAVFVYGNTFDVFTSVVNNSEPYGEMCLHRNLSSENTIVALLILLKNQPGESQIDGFVG